MSPKGGNQPEGSGVARLAGSGTAGVLELVLFHPVDTVAKRLMTNETKIFGNGNVLQNLNKAVFKVPIIYHGLAFGLLS